MDEMQRQEMNALLELIKRHAKSVTKEQLIEDLEAMQSKLEDKSKAASDTPNK